MLSVTLRKSGGIASPDNTSRFPKRAWLGPLRGCPSADILHRADSAWPRLQLVRPLSLQAPEQYPIEVWQELVARGRLKQLEGGRYELIGEDDCEDT